MRNFILALVAVAALATTVNAGWTVIYDFQRKKPVVIYTPDRPTPTYVYPAPCPYEYRYQPYPAYRPYDYYRYDRDRHDRGRNHRNPCR